MNALFSTSADVGVDVSSPLRQSFSVSYHYSLNRILVSDGYSITVLQFPCDWDSSSVVRTLCVEANKCLQQTVDLDVELQCHNSDNKINYPVDEADIASSGSLADDQFTSTHELSVTASSFVVSDLNISQGVVQFAGIDTDFSVAGGSTDRKHFVKRLFSVLTTAWALILSDGKRRLESRDDGSVIFQRGLVSDAVCSWLLDVYGIAWGLCDESYKHLLLLEEQERMSLFQSALSLVNLDSIRQQRLDLVLKMVRMFVSGQLSQPCLNDDNIDKRVNLLTRLRELMLFVDRVIAHSYNWHSWDRTSRQELQDSLLCTSDVFLPFMIQSQLTGVSVSSMTHATKVPSCWKLIHWEAKSLSARLLSCKSSPNSDIAQCADYESNIQLVLKSALKLYGAICGDVQRLDLDISMSNSQLAGKTYLEDQFEKQIETLKSGTVHSHQTLDRDTEVSEELPFSDGDESKRLLSQLILHFYRYDIRSALLLLDSILDVSCYYLNMSVSEDSSNLDELHRIRDVAQIRPGSGQKKETTASELLDFLPLLTVKSSHGAKAVKCFAQLIASYFANLPLLVAPAHCPAVSPSLSELIHDVACVAGISSRFSEVSRDLVRESIKEGGVADCWTVNLAVELLLVCGLTNDAVWFVYRLGDWRNAFTLSTILSHHSDLCKLHESKIDLQPHTLIKESLERHMYVQEIRDKITLFLSECQNYRIQVDEDRLGRSHIERIYELVIDTDPEDYSLNCAKIEDELHAAAVAGFELMTSLTNEFLSYLKRLVQQTSWIVAADFDLPAPPPFCPQSWNLSAELSEQVVIETGFRLLVHIVVRALVSLLKAGCCLHSCILSYVEQLRKEFVNKSKSSSYLRAFRKSREMLDDVVILEASPILSIFRDLCGVLWLLHVRDEIAHHLRKSRKGWSEAQVSDTVQWFDSALCFDQCLLDSDVLKKQFLVHLLDFGDRSCVAEFIGRHFRDEIGSQKESCYKKELKHIVDIIDPKDIGSPNDISRLSILCKGKADERVLCLQTMKQQSGSVNSLMGDRLNVTSLTGVWSFDVGSWECESSKIFAKYLNNSFEVMLAQRVSHTVHSSRTQTPCLPSLHKLSRVSSACETSAKWPQLLSLIVWLQKWSDHVFGTSVTSEAKIERGHSSQSSIKVSLTVETIASTLLLIEERCDYKHTDEKQTKLLEPAFKQHEMKPLQSLPMLAQAGTSNKDETFRNMKSEGELTLPSQLGSSLSSNIASFGEACSRKTGNDDTLSTVSMVSCEIGAAPQDSCSGKVTLLTLNTSELLEDVLNELSNVTGSDWSFYSERSAQSVRPLPVKQDNGFPRSMKRTDETSCPSNSNSVVLSGLSSHEEQTLEVGKLISAKVDSKDDCEVHDSEQIQVLARDDEDDSDDDDDSDVASGVALHISVLPSKNLSEVTRIGHEENRLVATDLVEKEVSTVVEGSLEAFLEPFIQDVPSNELSPLVMATETSARQSSTEPVFEVTDYREAGLSQILGQPAMSGLVETAVVQQSLAQQPFSRNELHQILQVRFISGIKIWTFLAYYIVLLFCRLRDCTLSKLCLLWKTKMIQAHFIVQALAYRHN